MKKGKAYLEKTKLVDRDKSYSPVEALRVLREVAFAKFDETVELHFNLGIDPRQSDQQIRGTLVLPHGTGKSIRIAVITNEKQRECQDAGADVVGSDDLIEQIQGGWMEFDLVITSPDMMAKVGRLGKTLGAKGLMPNPKSGTVTPNVVQAIKEFKAGKLEYRNDKTGIVHIVIGKKSFSDQQLLENLDAVYEVIQKVKPSKSKGVYLKSISMCTTMSPGLFIEPLKTKWKEA